MRAIMFLPVLCVAECTSSQYDSFVGPIPPQIAPQIAADMAAFVQARIKPADGPIRIERPSDDQTIGPVLTTDLQDSGFRISDARFVKHRVRYATTTLDGDVMLRVSVDGADAARLYHDKPGIGLTPLGPFSVTQAGSE